MNIATFSERTFFIVIFNATCDRAKQSGNRLSVTWATDDNDANKEA